MSSPESPRSGLRRRSQVNGAGGSFFVDTAARAGGAPTSPDAFGAFVSPTAGSPSWGGPPASQQEDPGLFESFETPARTSAAPAVDPADDEWEWAEAGVQTSDSMSPLTESTPVPPQPKVSNLPDWDAWLQDVENEDPSGASGSKAASGKSSRNGNGSSSGSWGKRPTASGSRGTTPSAISKPDDDFFAAFERAAIQQQSTRVPSPPMIDLRATERKLAGKPPAVDLAAGTAEDDFFSRFERSPQEAMADTAARRRKEEQEAAALRGPQLDSMADAQSSPLDMTPRGGREQSRRDNDYFGESGQRQDAGSSVSPSASGAIDPADSAAAPSSWSGSLRRTWSNLRGMSGELVNHLPSTTDFLVPPDDYEFEAARAAQTARAERRGSDNSTSNSNSGSRNGSEVTSSPLASTSPLPSESQRPIPSLAHTSDYAHSTPFGGPSSHSSHVGTSQRRNSRAGTAPISGAPGFRPDRQPHWNTGSWTLDSSSASEKSRARSIPVELLERRDETDEVVDAWHAARVHAALPPRLQLGRSWRLLYSMDQHGMSLGTLYHRVAAGMDPSKRKREGSVNETEPEGWLRGASGAAKAALGGSATSARVRHVGGGLNMSDAGLVVAVKDAEGNVFGAFVNERIRPQSGYYGSGECFLWRTAESSEPASPVRSSTDPSSTSSLAHDQHCIESYRWTGRNDYMVLTEAHYLSFGGGDGKYGLWLDGGLEKGISARCPAFNNEVLCQDGKRVQKKKAGEEKEEDPWGEKEEEGNDEEGEFECMGLEVWAVGVD